MIAALKRKLYFLKQWYMIVFTYPQEKLVVDEVLDYDVYWKQKRQVRADTLSKNERRRSEFVAQEINADNTEPVTIGDIACGPGVVYNFLKDHIKIKRMVGYDSSPFALDVAKEFGMETKLFDLNDDDDLKSLEQFDYFILLEILEHVPNSEKILDACYQKANKGVFFSFPNSGYFLYRLRMLTGKMPMQWIKFPNEHLRFWTNTDLKWWLKALGYNDYKIHYYRGIPGLQKIWPSLFAGSFVVKLNKK